MDWAPALTSSSTSNWLEVAPNGSVRYLIPPSPFILPFKNGFPMSYSVGMRERYMKETREVVHAVTATWKAPKLRVLPCKELSKMKWLSSEQLKKEHIRGEVQGCGQQAAQWIMFNGALPHTGHQSMVVFCNSLINLMVSCGVSNVLPLLFSHLPFLTSPSLPSLSTFLLPTCPFLRLMTLGFALRSSQCNQDHLCGHWIWNVRKKS